MAEAGSQWYNPFDPQDPDALASAALGTNPQEYAAQVATAPPRQRLAIYRKPVEVQTPQQRISAGFGAADVEDRSAPGYPGSFLYPGSVFDPNEARALGVPVEEGGFYARDTRAPAMEDYFNPLSQDLGVMNVFPAAMQDRITVLKAQKAEIERRLAEQEKKQRK